MGDILHISITPAPRNCPREVCTVKSGIPIPNVSKRNCRMKFAVVKKKILNLVVNVVPLLIIIDKFHKIYNYGELYKHI